MKTTSQQIKVRACSIVCNEHPEWGTWGVMEDRGDWFEILGQSGGRMLFKPEADQFWSVVGADLAQRLRAEAQQHPDVYADDRRRKALLAEAAEAIESAQ